MDILTNLFAYYLIFIFAIPLAIIKLYGFDSLKLYLPSVDLIANSLKAAGYPDYFQDVYDPSPKNMWTYASTNTVSAIALIGVLWQTYDFYIETNKKYLTVIKFLIMVVITFLIPTQLIPVIINKIKENEAIKHKITVYILSFILIAVILLTEYIITRLFL